MSYKYNAHRGRAEEMYYLHNNYNPTEPQKYEVPVMVPAASRKSMYNKFN